MPLAACKMHLPSHKRQTNHRIVRDERCSCSSPRCSSETARTRQYRAWTTQSFTRKNMSTTRASLFLLGLVLLAFTTQVVAKGHTECKRFRHITTFKDAPKNASDVRNALMRQWNKLQPKHKCIYWAVSFAAAGDNTTAFPYNWGATFADVSQSFWSGYSVPRGFFDFKNRESYDAFRTWLIQQPSFQSTFGRINANAVRFNTCPPY